MDSDSALADKLREEVTCSICIDLYDEPLQLPCQHSFCKACLEVFVQGKPLTEIKCPMCSQSHKLDNPGDISQFPSDLLAKRLVSHLKKPFPNSADSSQINPEALLNASAPYMEDHPDRFQQIDHNIQPSAPPAELFDAPPKQHQSLQPHDIPASNFNPDPIPWYSRLFGGKQSSSKEPVPSSSSSSSQASSSNVVQHNNSNSAIASSSDSKVGAKVEPKPSSSIADSNSVQKSNKTIELRSEMMPPLSTLLPGCQAQYIEHEILMPFIITPAEIGKYWNEWWRSLWWTSMNNALLKDYIPLLVPAWKINATISIKYTSVASIRRESSKNAKKDVSYERHHVEGQITIPDFSIVVPALRPETCEYHDMIQECSLTDILPYIPQNSLFWSLFGSKTRYKLSDFPVPEGQILDRTDDWFSEWTKRTSKLQTDPRVSVPIIAQAKSRPGLSEAEVKIDTVLLLGFHQLSIQPMRIPMYLCTYLHPDRPEGFTFIMSGQTGEVHDAMKRPFTKTGNFLSSMFPGAFKK